MASTTLSRLTPTPTGATTKMMHPMERRTAERNGMARLTFKQAERIRRAYKAGTTQVALAKKYGVASQTISAICTGRRYATPPSSEIPARIHRQTRGHK